VVITDQIWKLPFETKLHVEPLVLQAYYPTICASLEFLPRHEVFPDGILDCTEAPPLTIKQNFRFERC
jgi:hypothetical protein